jgi:lysozyme family protein
MPQASPANYPSLFLQAVARVLANEGGYAKLAEDPGGATNFGISQRDYPGLNVRELTRDDAVAIYFRDFWKTERYAELPAIIAIKLFDLSVNMGPAHAVRCLQRSLRACGRKVAEDGALGDASIAAANDTDSAALLPALRSEAAGYYRATAENAPGKRKQGDANFLEGWLNRAYQ